MSLDPANWNEFRALAHRMVDAGRYAIRCAITNHRTRREDLDALVNAVVAMGDALRFQVAE